LAVDEWGIVRDWNPAPDGPGIGPFEHYYPLGDGLAAARALHELIRSSDIVRMANWAQTVNVIGAIKTSRNYAVLDSVGHVLTLYRAQMIGRLAPVRLSPEAPVDAVAAVEPTVGRLALGLINFSPALEVNLKVQPLGGRLPQNAKAWRINGPSLTSINIPGEPESITTEALARMTLDDPIRLPPHSITVLSGQSQ
jgi:alpha-N-arabinofuranosidase